MSNTRQRLCLLQTFPSGNPHDYNSKGDQAPSNLIDIPTPHTMSTSLTNAGPNDSVWDRYKETIRALYLDENRNLEEVRSEMKTMYQFDAT
jgi:Clr5 domain